MNLKSALLLSTLAAGATAHGIVLSVFNFNDGTASANNAANTAALFASDRTTTGIAAGLSTNFGAANITSFGGSTIGADSGDAAGQALALQSGTSNANNGRYLLLTISATSGLLSLFSLTFAAQRSTLGFTTQTYAYSVDGVNFTDLASATIPTAYALQTISLASVPTASTLYLRDTLTGSTSADAFGNNRIDNLVVNGSVVANPTPEPGALAALGVGAVALLRRRRKA